MNEYWTKTYYAECWKNRGERVWNIYKKTRGGIIHLITRTPGIKDQKSELRKLLEEDIKKYGYFSPRPYKLAQPCDGSISTPVIALFIDFCSKNNLNWKELLIETYGKDFSTFDEKFTKKFAEWQGVEYPKIWDEKAYKGLIESLSEINYHSLIDTLEEKVKDKFS